MLYNKLDKVRLKQEIVHKAEWECRKRLEERAQLESALEQCEAVLYIEREKMLANKRKCDQLRLNQHQQKKQILDKLASTNSVEQHVYYNHQQAPERIQSYAKKTGNFQAAQERNTELWKVKQIEEGKGVPRQAALQAQIA